MREQKITGHGPTVAVVRKFRLLTQADLARRVGKSSGWVHGIESGRIVLDGVELDEVAAALEVTAQALGAPAAKPAVAS